jgi:16S rRNA (cytosine1402-N4)-methyltransferase
MERYDYHIPVLLQASIEALAIRPDGTYVDATFGGGGHSKEILKSLGPKGKLIVFDLDADAVEHLPQDPRVIFVHHNYAYLSQFLTFLGIDKVDGILADLGISSHQIDTPERGFAHRFEGPLDMRMSKVNPLSAENVINTYSEEALTQVFRNYGELTQARRIANCIVEKRKESPISTTHALLEVVKSFEKGPKTGQFRSQLFQALRIEVNGELEGLKAFLLAGAKHLDVGGRFAVMSYHSLEDRLVKNFFKTGDFDGKHTKDFFGVNTGEWATAHKLIVPDAEEIARNNRARSAKLRVVMKKGTKV